MGLPAPHDPALAAAAAPEPMGPARLLGLALLRWKLVALIVALTTTGAFAYSQFVLARDPLFKAAATLDIQPSQAQLDYANSFVRGMTLQSGAVLTQTHAEYAMSRPVIESVADDYLARNPDALEPKQGGLGIRRTLRVLDQGGEPIRDPRTMFIESLRKSLDIGNVAGTYLLRIEVSWGDPHTAAAFANEFAERLIDDAARRTNGSTDQLHDTLAEKLAEARAALNERQIEAATTRASLGVADIQRQKQSVIEEKLAEEARLTNERAQIAASATQVGALQRETDGLLSSATPAVEQALSLERPRLAGLQQSVRQRAARVGQLGSQLDTLNRSETRLGVLDREIEALQAQVAALTERYNAVQIDTLAGAPPVRIIEPATPPLARDSPRVVTNTAMGFVGGCALAGMLLLLLPAPAVASVKAEEAEEEEPIALPPRDEPPAAPAVTGRVYPGVLVPPARGRGFSADESRAIRRNLGAWLAAPLDGGTRTFYVLSADQDADAEAVYNLVGQYLQSRGEVVNADLDPVADAQGATTRSRALFFCGGLGESGRIPPCVDREEELIFAVRRGSARQSEVRFQLEQAGWADPYLIEIEG